MKQILIHFLTVLSTTLCIGTLGAWIASTDYQINVVWSNGETHNEFVSYNGALYLFQNYEWWRRESLMVYIDPSPYWAPIESGPGMRIDSQSDFWGVKVIRGEYLSSFTLVTDDDEITTTKFSVEPGTMLRTTTPMQVVGIDYWLLLLLPASWLGVKLFRICIKMRTAHPTFLGGAFW